MVLSAATRHECASRANRLGMHSPCDAPVGALWARIVGRFTMIQRFNLEHSCAGLFLSGFAFVIPAFAQATLPPYPRSHTITGMSWDLSTVTSLRKAVGSDLWPLTWAADGNLYGAWGDGGGFNGTEQSKATGRASLGFARILGTPEVGRSDSYWGENIWGQAPKFAEYQATFGGKVDDLISVAGVLYGQGGLWTAANCHCTDPTLKNNDNPVRTLTWSTNLGRTWSIASWTRSSDLGSSLKFGPDYSGAWDPAHIYWYYQGEVNVDATHLYLRRTAVDRLTADPATPGVLEYFAGVDSAGSPLWSIYAANAVAVFDDRSIPPGVYANQGVVYDPPLGRYIVSAFHGDDAGQIGFFEGPNPWGPWSTIAYYDDWGSFNERAGEANGLGFPSKWISADGRTLWGVFSGQDKGRNGTNDFDSFNLAQATLTVVEGLPEITAPAAGTAVNAGEPIRARGLGAKLSWNVARVGQPDLPIASGSGANLEFTVPSGLKAGELIRLTLSNPEGRVYRDLTVTKSRASAPLEN
jgi:hypothetical protein